MYKHLKNKLKNIKKHSSDIHLFQLLEEQLIVHQLKKEKYKKDYKPKKKEDLIPIDQVQVLSKIEIEHRKYQGHSLKTQSDKLTLI